MKWWTPEADAVQELAWFDPLVVVSRRARAAQIVWPVFIDEFEFFGRVDRAPRPSISVYGHLQTGQPLLCDDHGVTYAFVEQRGNKGAGRFKEVSLRGALWQCGLPEIAEATLTPRPARPEVDDVDDLARPALRVV
jgi:hypothetical protein